MCWLWCLFRFVLWFWCSYWYFWGRRRWRNSLNKNSRSYYEIHDASYFQNNLKNISSISLLYSFYLYRCEISMLVIFLIGQKYLNSGLLNHHPTPFCPSSIKSGLTDVVPPSTPLLIICDLSVNWFVEHL